MLQVKNLVKRFGEREVVRGISFEVEKGESFGLLGPNGAGKSTTISIISGLLSPDAGEVLVGGVDVLTDPHKAKRLMGVVPQEIALYLSLSARENLHFWGALYGLSGKLLRSRVDEALEIVGLTERQKDRVGTFSGGMKRRLNIAASLLHQPELLIMDEPTVGIDPQSRNKILETVRQLNSEKHMTVIYTSHYMEEVQYLSQRVVILDHGEVIANGTVDEVRRLMGTDTVIRLKVQEPDEQTAMEIGGVRGVRRAWVEKESIAALVGDLEGDLPPLLSAIRTSGKQLLGVEVQEPSLETVFLHLTGHALRDQE